MIFVLGFNGIKTLCNIQGKLMKARGLTRETVLDFGTTDRKFPEFRVGDTIEVSQVIKEGEKERIQLYAGDVIAFHRNGASTTFTVRRIGANGIGVERIFPYYSKLVGGIRLVKRGNVRRAKLYYIRELSGRAAKIKERLRAPSAKRSQTPDSVEAN